VKSPGKRKRVI